MPFGAGPVWADAAISKPRTKSARQKFLRMLHPSICLLGIRSLGRSLDDDGGEIVLLFCATRKLHDGAIQTGNDFVGRFFFGCANPFLHSLCAELLALRIGPFEESVGREDEHIAVLEVEAQGRIRIETRR